MDAEERLRGWRDRLAEAGMGIVEAERGDWSPDAGYRIGTRLIAAGTPSALFASNDQMALGMLHAAHDAGLRVPEDISIVGFDDIPEAAHFAPPLTTVRQDFVSLGRDAMVAVLAVLQDEESGLPPAPREPQLIVRESARRV